MSVREFLTRDHERLDRLLAQALVDDDSYREFRSGLLWHIGVEEKILFPIFRTAVGDSELIRQLHRDHAALGALLMPPPTAAYIGQIRTILEAHNPLEEGPGGFYDTLEQVANVDAVMEQVRAYPAVRVAPHADTEVTRWSIEELVRLAEEGRSKS